MKLCLCLLVFGCGGFAQPFQTQLLGVDPVTNKIVIVGIDSKSIVIDRSSPASPYLKCIATPTVTPRLLGFRATAVQQSDGTWTFQNTFTQPQTQVADATFEVFLNGIYQHTGSAVVTYLSGSSLWSIKFPQQRFSGSDQVEVRYYELLQ